MTRLRLLVLFAILGACNTTPTIEIDAAVTDAGDRPDAADADGRPDAATDAGAKDAEPTTGQSCAKAEDCGSGFDCAPGIAGGYCWPGAPGGPTACRDPEAPCPIGTTCSPLPWHAISGVCLRPCEDVSGCGPNQTCTVVELFPGDATAPRSPTKVCWFACQPGADQSCNDNPSVSSIHGRCEPDGTCTCGGYPKNANTGRCQ